MLDFVDRRLGRGGGREGAKPGIDIEIAVARLGDGRNVRQRLARVRLPTASARNFPAFKYSDTFASVANIEVTCWPKTALSAGPLPGYGTKVISTLAARLSISKPS